MQTILVTTITPVVRTCTCMLHADILHTTRSLVFVLVDADDAAGAERVEPAEHPGGEGANANNTGDDRDPSEDTNN